MKLSDLKQDVSKIEAGAWIGNIPEMGELRLKVLGIQCGAYRRKLTQLTDAVPRAKKVGGRVDSDEQDRILGEALAATILQDWDGIEGDDGQPLPFDPEQARVMLTSPQFRRFRDAVIYASTMVGEIGQGEAA